MKGSDVISIGQAYPLLEVANMTPSQSEYRMIGRRFGYWTVVSLDSRVPHTKIWLCSCQCGAIRTVHGKSLMSGHSRSCGCLKKMLAKERLGRVAKTHGMTSSSEYNTWRAMVARCQNSNHMNFKYYGGRGIQVCERWRTFENFFADMGRKEEGLTLDRIDVNGMYELSNCRWATWKEQANNKRCNKNGVRP